MITSFVFPKDRIGLTPVTLIVTTLNATMLILSIIYYHKSLNFNNLELKISNLTRQERIFTESEKMESEKRKLLTDNVGICSDPIWCTIPMPAKSYFKFDPPVDEIRWRQAQIQAANGEQVLLKYVRKAFPTHFDFLDGDITFRKLHYAMDIFLDEARDLSPLVGSGKNNKNKKASDSSPHEDEEHRLSTVEKPLYVRRLEWMNESLPEEDIDVLFEDFENRRKLADGTEITAAKMVNGKLRYPWELQGKRVIPDPYDFRGAKRAPVVSIGYTAYTRDSQTYFSGNRIGGAYINRQTFFKYWRKVMNYMDTPFVAVCVGNENWGFLSTKFPNRTAGWGQCCNTDRDKIVYDFLNHPKTLMLVTNQHTNVSHPKLLILPRGIPITWGSTRVMVWDAQREVEKEHKKNKLFFAASSSWGPRPQILACISKRFSPEDFDGHVNHPAPPRLERKDYYIKMGTSMFGLALPGLGYDTFRTWELLTMGTIPVLEKAVGFDRSMWRLPALLVEDFSVLTPELLRQAYIEALYRAEDFEFHRLTMNFWFSVIANVSASMSSQPLLDTFPMAAEEPNFMRPRELFNCWKTNSCGKGTMRIPTESC